MHGMMNGTKVECAQGQGQSQGKCESEQNAVTVVLGAQWGDEGKGKIVDMLSLGADIVARCQVCSFSFSFFHCPKVSLTH